MPINETEKLDALAALVDDDPEKSASVTTTVITNHEEWQRGFDAVLMIDGSEPRPYRLVNLPDLFRNIQPIINVKGQFDTKEVLAELLRVYGVKFTSNDVTIQFIEGRRIEPGHSYDAHILSKVSSRVFKGCATIRLYNPKV